MLWEEYLRAHPDGYQNSQFCYHFHRWRNSRRGELLHEAGEKLFVDYAGDRLIVDPDSARSSGGNVRGDPRGQRADLRGGQRHATGRAGSATSGSLRYSGGGQVIVPDNLRSAVSRS